MVWVAGFNFQRVSGQRSEGGRVFQRAQFGESGLGVKARDVQGVGREGILDEANVTVSLGAIMRGYVGEVVSYSVLHLEACKASCLRTSGSRSDQAQTSLGARQAIDAVKRIVKPQAQAKAS